MFGKSKKFDKSLFSRNDPKSRKIIKEYYLKNGIILEDNINKFGVDLISTDGQLQIELEHRIPWMDDEFPYDDINVPERKAKFFRDGKVHYIILSRDYSHIGIITGEQIKPFIIDENLKENRNKYVKVDEYFYKIPKSKFEFKKII